MVRFTMLGSVDLKAEDGRPLQSVLSQPKRTAVLAFLALAEPGTFVRRDTLLAVFWPETDESRARKSLNTTVHFLRKSLGTNVIVGRGSDEIGLSADHLRCDASELLAALARGDDEAAVEKHGGDLLPGFLLDDAPEFHRWLDEARARLVRRVAEAYGRLMRSAADAGDRPAATRWARKVAEMDPFSEAAVRDLMSLLYAQGDKAGALVAYGDFADRLERELETTPSEPTRRLAEEIQGGTLDVAVTAPAGLGELVTTGGTGAREGDPGGVQGQVDVGVGPNRGRRLLRIGAPLGIVAILAAIFLGWPQPVSPPVPAGVVRVAVLPFAFDGDPGLDYLSTGIVDLLGDRMNIPDQVHTVDAHAALSSVRRGLLGTGAVDRGPSVARALGAHGYVDGFITEAGGRLELHATLYDARGEQVGSASAGAQEEAGIFEAVDELARGLLVGLYDAPDEREIRTAAHGTESLPAFKRYLEGERAFREGRYDAAIEPLMEATMLDSLYALAFYRLDVAALWAGRWELMEPSAARAWELRDRLPEPERLLLEARRAPDPVTGGRFLRSAVVRYPDFVEGWYALADRYFHFGHWGSSVEEVRSAFERVLAHDPDNEEAILHYARLAALDRDVEALAELAEEKPGASGGGEWGLEVRALAAFLSGDDRAVAAALEELRALDDEALGRIGTRLVGYARPFGRAEGLYDIMDDPTRAPEVRALGRILEAFDEAVRGHLSRARQLLADAGRTHPGMALTARALVALVPDLPVDPGELEGIRRGLASWDGLGGPARSVNLGASDWLSGFHADVQPLLLGLILNELGDSPGALGVAARLEEGTGTAGARVIRSAVALREGHADQALAILGEETYEAAYEPAALEPFLRARLLMALDRPEDALRWLDAMTTEHPFSFLFLPSRLRRGGAVLADLGRGDDAVVRYDQVLDLWSDAEPALAPLVAEVGQARDALVGGSRPPGAPSP